MLHKQKANGPWKPDKKADACGGRDSLLNGALAHHHSDYCWRTAAYAKQSRETTQNKRQNRFAYAFRHIENKPGSYNELREKEVYGVK